MACLHMISPPAHRPRALAWSASQHAVLPCMVGGPGRWRP